MTRWTIASLAATAALLIQMPLPAEPPAAAPPVAGWRGNYTGTFPDSRPPTRWRKVSKVVAALRCRAAKPENEGPAGVSAANGAFTEWMVLGPLNSGVTTDKEAIGKAFVEDEASWRPDGREVVRDRTWRRVTTPGTVLDFTAVFAGEVPHPKPAWDHQVVFKAPHVAYACTYVHSPERVTLHYATRWGGQCRMWVNDRPLSQSALTDREHLELKKLTLEKGWNRVLYKAANTPSSQKPERGRNPWSFWFAELEVRGVRPREERVENILWQTPTPYYHLACPLIVGDRVFVMAKPADLICLDKKSGRIRWIRSPRVKPAFPECRI